MWLIVLTAIYFGLVLIGWIINRAATVRENRAAKLRKREGELRELGSQLQQQAEDLASEKAAFERYRIDAKHGIDTLAKEKALGFPWLATAYSEYFHLLDRTLAKELEVKKQPAKRSADVIRTIAREKAALRRENKILRDLHRYYEYLFPWLIDFKGEELDEVIRQAHEFRTADDGQEDVDPAVIYLTAAEYSSGTLMRVEKFQRALDRYWSRRKTPWQIGRDYERYIGYIHERDGFKVEYHGIEYGYEDLGRDLICIKGDDIRVIQCKCWSTDKVIHEKHICQLIGTTIMYEKTRTIDPILFGKPRITSWLYTSAILSETAANFASMLGVQIVQNVPLGRYPAIKCNVSLRDGTKIYHLPFDQQYDRTLIEFKDECYVETVVEAEALGFRRAFRWRGSKEATTPA
jgi:hypothetical protein